MAGNLTQAALARAAVKKCGELLDDKKGETLLPPVNEGGYNEKALIDKYAFGASFTPPYIPEESTSYKVSGSSYTPIEEVKELYAIDLKEDEEAVISFLSTYDIKLNQNQFDALVSFTHQYSTEWWTKEPEKQLPKFIREGEGTYEEEKVRSVFALHYCKERRAIEAEVFINGYE